MNKSNEYGPLPLPSEILAHILQYLSVFDCINLQNILKNNPLRNICNDRLSIEKYFTNNFYDGKVIINILQATDAYLCEEKAVEYFTPELSKEGSSWKFCIGTDKRKVTNFMKSMETIGVTWDTLQTRVIALKENKVPFIIRCSKYLQLVKEWKEWKFKPAPPMIKIMESSIAMNDDGCITAVYDENEKRYTIGLTRSDSSIKEVVDKHPDLVDDHSYDIVYGSLNVRGVNHRIDVICYNRTDSEHTEYLLEQPFNILNCFVSGFGAGHMYAELLKHKRMVLWISERSQVYRTDNTLRDGRLQHYLDCDYELSSLIESQFMICDISKHFNKSFTIVYRHLADSKSIFIPQEPSVKWQCQDWIKAQNYFSLIPWKENYSRMHLAKSREKNTVRHYNACQYILLRNSLLNFETDIDYLRLYGLFI